jgi:hypothetical protein
LLPKLRLFALEDLRTNLQSSDRALNTAFLNKRYRAKLG